MRRLGLWILALVAGATLVMLLCSNHDSNINTSLNYWDTDHLKNSEMITSTRRIVKETNIMTKARLETEIDSGSLNVEDYPHFDPTPNSKANIKNGPIEHSTPLIPYVPKPNPPPAPSRQGSGSAPGPLNQPVFPPPPHM